MDNFLDSFGTDLTAAVVGASGAIGGAMVRRLESCAGVNRIYVLSRSGRSPGGSKTITLPVDLLSETSIAEAAQDISEPLNLILVATGVLHQGENLKPEKCIKDFQSEHFAQIFAINTTGPAMIARYFLPKLIRQKKCLFAVLSARVGSITDNQMGGWYAYRASKAALNMIIKNLSIEIGRKNKSAVIAALHPGTVDSHLSMPFQSGVPEGKLFSPDFAAGQLLNIANQLTTKDSGHLVAWDGENLPF